MTSFHSLKQKILNIHQNYLLAKKVYPKHIVRGGIYKAGKRRTSRIVDNSFELRTANIKKKRFKKKGQQVFSKKQFFEPKGLKSLSFTEFLFCYRKRTTFILKLKKALRKATSQRTNYFFILRSTNGGFSVYFSGIRGFVPRSQLQIFKNQIIKKYRLIKKKIPKKFGIKQKKLFNGKKIFVLSFPFKLLKFAVNLQRKKKWVNRKTKKEFWKLRWHPYWKKKKKYLKKIVHKNKSMFFIFLLAPRNRKKKNYTVNKFTGKRKKKRLCVRTKKLKMLFTSAKIKKSAVDLF